MPIWVPKFLVQLTLVPIAMSINRGKPLGLDILHSLSTSSIEGAVPGVLVEVCRANIRKHLTPSAFLSSKSFLLRRSTSLLLCAIHTALGPARRLAASSH